MTATTFTPVSSDVFDPWLSSHHWTPSTLTFSFPTSSAFYGYSTEPGLTELSASQKDAARKALAEIASFTGLTFVEVTESFSTEGTLRFINEPGLGGAYAYLPSRQEQGGDLFFGSGTTNPTIGNEAYLYFTHEIGHAMGLEHGHEFPGFVATGLDSQEYTVVTYTDYVGDTDTFSFDSGPIDWAQSYQQLDIAALQFLYGANYAATGEVWSGNTVYTFSPTTGEMSINGVGQGTPAGNRIFRTIWDGHGEDTYDLSNYSTNLDIDLAPGAFSTFSSAQLADLNSPSPGTELAAGNVANARLVGGDTRALIENAIGGSGRDSISGNQADNELSGNANRDKLYGLEGEDELNGGRGRDLLVGGDDDDRLRGENGHDDLRGGAGDDVLLGGKNNDTLLGQSGKDDLRGGSGDDDLIGGKGRDKLRGGAGDDDFIFQAVSDSLLGSQSDIILDFVSGEDQLDLSLLTAGTLTLAIGGGFDGVTPMVVTSQAGSDLIVEADVDGDGSADFRVILDNVSSISAGDFLL